MRRIRPLTFEEAATLTVMQAQALQTLSKGNLSETDQAALELRAEGTM